MIRYAAPEEDDIPALAALGRETFVEAFGHLYRPEDLSAFLAQAYSAETVASVLRDARQRYRIAFEDARPVGYARIALDPQFADYDPGGKRIVELKQLYVRASHHGGGVAAALMDWTVREARAAGADEIVLSVYSGNARGQAFYRKHGFEWLADTFFMVGSQRDNEFLFIRRLKD